MMERIKVSEKLKPCPFCGGKAVITAPLEGLTGYGVRCEYWGCCEKFSDQDDEDLDNIVRKWNKRLGEENEK